MRFLELLRFVAARHAGFLLAIAVLLAGFQFLICAAVSSIDVGSALETLTRSLPPMFQALVASQFFGGFSPRGLVAFGWNHPVAHALGSSVAIVLAARAVAGEIETGAIELVLSQPLPRAVYFGAQAGFALAAIGVVSAAGAAGTALGLAAFHIEGFPAGALTRLAIGYAVLQASVYGVTLLLSVSGREGGRVASAGFLIVLASYFAQAIGRMWSKAAWILPWTLHDHFAPQKILIEGAGIGGPAAVLGGVAVASLVAAWARFRTRDLP